MEVKTNHGLKLNGFYRGQVVKHCDSGKCKVFIPGVFPDFAKDNPENIPDAEQAAPIFGGSNKGSGMFSYPNIGATVWCFFENGDQNRPVYFAATLGGELPTNSVGRGYLEVRESDDDAESTSGEDSTEHMIVCGFSKICIRESGQVDITCEDPQSKTSASIQVDSRGMVQIDADSAIQIDAPALKINAGQFELNADTCKIRATTTVQLQVPKFVSSNSNQATIISPAINLNAAGGMVFAKGENHPALMLT